MPQAAGVALRSATEAIDIQGPVGRMLLQLLGIFAEFERGLLIDRITKGFERKAARGEWLGGPGPFGYCVDPATKTLVPDSAEAVIVRRIFAAYADGHLGATGLANHLNGAGLRNRSDRFWSKQAVLRVLRNPVYVATGVRGESMTVKDYAVLARDSKVTVTSSPPWGRGRTLILASCVRATAATMASPSPWPSAWRRRWEPGCWKGWKSRSICSGETVGPVLATVMVARPGGERVETSTSPPGGERLGQLLDVIPS